MWALRALNGALAGKVFNLKSGKNLLGRSAHCDIQIASNGISKEHCEVHVYPDKILLVDLKSSNGTYLNGVKIQNATMRMGDKMNAHDIIFDLVPAQEKRIVQKMVQVPVPMGAAAPAMQPGDFAAEGMAFQTTGTPVKPTPMVQQNAIERLWVQAQDFIERVALPGVYKLPEWFEFRWVLGGFVILFVFVVTLLAMIPTFQSAKESVMGESRRRALSTARHLAELNQKVLLEGQFGALSTHSAELEEGIKDVFIIQKSDGMILAPPSRAGRTSDVPFVHKVRTEDRPISAELSGSQVGASAPIGQFDPATGLPSVKAYAVVIYDVSDMILGSNRAISLFMQILVIAAGVGALLFFFLVKVVEKPVRELNEHLDNAMRERRDNITMKYLYPDLQALVGNINSLLSRSLSPEMTEMPMTSAPDRQQEAQNLVSMAGIPALTIGSDQVIWNMNEAFQRLMGQDVTGQSYKMIPDTSLQQNIDGLIEKAQQHPYSTHFDTLEFSGHPCHVQLLAFHTQGHIDYYFVSITPVGGDD